jgi:hypothetical protein
VFGLAALVAGTQGLRAQQPDGGAEMETPSPSSSAVIDTVMILRDDVFTEEEAGRSFLYRTMNALHVLTRPGVIRRELLLREGEPYDSVLADESERNLRRRRLFADVRVDTVRVEDQLALRVRTQDAWSTRPKVEFAAASNGTVTGAIGVTEFNLLGTGIPLQFWYRKTVDRDGIVTSTALNRFAGTDLFLGGSYQGLSDQRAGRWRVGLPFYSLSDRRSVDYSGYAFDGRVFQYRTEAPGVRDTVIWQRRALLNRLAIAFAPVAGPTRYLRVGAQAEVRREEYFLRGTPAESVPDSVFGLVGAFVEYRLAEFDVVEFYNSFQREDQDLSEVFLLGLRLAPAGWGYERTGIGPRVRLQAGGRLGGVIARAVVDANALFNSAGLDSGRVVARATVGYKPHDRQAVLFALTGGLLEDPAPGSEFDLGFQIAPRLWSPHAFTGTRSMTATLEHRWYAIDDLFHLIGLGIASFVDYGGAWFDDQQPRFGGNVGVGLLLGSALTGSPQTGQISVGYRFGNDLRGQRWIVSVGSGLFF